MTVSRYSAARIEMSYRRRSWRSSPSHTSRVTRTIAVNSSAPHLSESSSKARARR